MIPDKKPIWEWEECSRCHGRGEYSYCSDYGSRCFRCGGRKMILTKRGAAARAYFHSLCTVRYQDLKVGDRITNTRLTNGGRAYQVTAVVSETPSLVPSAGSCRVGDETKTWTHRLRILLTDRYGSSVLLASPDGEVLLLNPPNRQALVQKALEFQKTLTKNGKPRKVRK